MSVFQSWNLSFHCTLFMITWIETRTGERSYPKQFQLDLMSSNGCAFASLCPLQNPRSVLLIRLGWKTTKVAGDSRVNQEMPLKAPCWSHPLICHSAYSICLWPPLLCLVNFIWHFDCPQLLWYLVQRVQNIVTAFIARLALPFAQVTSW